MKRWAVSVGVGSGPWLLMGASVLGCAGAPAAQKLPHVAVSAAPEAQAGLAPEPPLPPLSAPPAETPEMLLRFDPQRLTHGITQGTKVSLNAQTIIDIGSFLGADPSQPLTLASTLELRRVLWAWRTASGASLARGPVEAATSEQGWTPLATGSCSLGTTSKSGAIVACGSTESLLAFGAAVRENVGNLSGDHALEIDLDLGSTWDRLGIHGLRDSVPKRVDALLDAPALSQSLPLHLAVSDLGFDLAGRLLEASQDLGRVQLAVALDEQGAGQYQLNLAPGGDTPLAEALARARPLTAPKGLWQLPYDTESAEFVDSSVLVPFLTPGRRALALLAQVPEASGAGAFAAALGGAFAACVAPGHALVHATGHVSLPKITEKKAASGKASTASKLPQKPRAEQKQTEQRSSYEVLELDDPGGVCASGLGTLLKTYAAQAASGKTATELPLEILKPGGDVPQATWVARFSSSGAAAYVALSTIQSTTQITSAENLATLRAGLAALRDALAKRHTLAERSDLTTLSKASVLLGGFAAEQAVSSGMGSTDLRAHSEWRVPFAVTREGSSLSVVGTLQAQTMRRLGAQLLERIWDKEDWSKLREDQKSALARVLDGACRLGDSAACNGLGVRYGDGSALTKNVDRARELLTLGCEQDLGMACVNLGFYGASPSEQLTTFKKACELESPFGCAWYGTRLLQSPKSDDHLEAVPKLEFACDAANGFGCSELALAYLKGIGVSEDDEKAADYEARSCRLGFGSGCVGLGHALANGVGRKKSSSAALEAYQAACRLDKSYGCYALGIAYLRGVGAPKDLDAARSQLSVACDAGHADACRVLAEMTEAP